MDVTFNIVSPAESLTLTPLSVFGFDDVGGVRLVRPVRSVATDGTVRHRALGFQRVITINLGKVYSVTNQSFLARWLIASERSITYGSETASVTLANAQEYAAEAGSGKLFRNFSIQVLDRTVRLDPPLSWQDAPVTWTTWGQTNIRPFGDIDYTLASLP